MVNGWGAPRDEDEVGVKKKFIKIINKKTTKILFSPTLRRTLPSWRLASTARYTTRRRRGGRRG